ncbi:hypothetical protein SFUMM280S_05971 [Streptomyces fumanus]
MITVVGTGVGAPPGPEVTAGAELVVGGRRHLDAAPVPESAERVVLGALAPALDRIARYVAQGRRVLVLASGDPGFFGIVRVLAERFGPERLDVRPGSPRWRRRSRGSGCRGTTRWWSARTDGTCGRR